MGYCSNVSLIVGSKLRTAIKKYVEKVEPNNGTLKMLLETETTGNGGKLFRYNHESMRWYFSDCDDFESWLTSHDWFKGKNYNDEDEEWGYSFIRVGEDDGDIDRYGNYIWQWTNTVIEPASFTPDT